MDPITSLDTLAETPRTANANTRVVALSEWLTALHSISGASLTSLFAGADTLWDSPELEGLPDVRRWLPATNAGSATIQFFKNELDFVHRAGDAIHRAADLVGIDPVTLQKTPPDGEKNLIETLMGTLINEWVSPRLCESFWKDQHIKKATRAIYGLSLEADNYLVFVGRGEDDTPRVVVLGEQPFESPLYEAGSDKIESHMSIPETVDHTGTIVEALDVLPASWWSDLKTQKEDSFLRACFMQMAIPGHSLDASSVHKMPDWRGIPYLPLSGPMS